MYIFVLTFYNCMKINNKNMDKNCFLNVKLYPKKQINRKIDINFIQKLYN